MKKNNEFSFIDYLKMKTPRTGRVLVGIGDDAAVLNVAPGKQLVVSTDVIVENVDFTFKTLKPEQIGRKALAINLSDMAAMGAKPTAFVVSVGKPKCISAIWLKRFYAGLLALAEQYNVACVGGDFSGSKEFFASVTILGEVSGRKAVKRSGARGDDWIAVTGSLGGSIMRHHSNFTPRVKEGLFLSSQGAATAMIDISDGLVQDLGHILKASNVGAVLDLDKIPVSYDAKKLSAGGKAKALVAALTDGEDFELLFTVASSRKRLFDQLWEKKFPKVPLSWIGKIEGTPGRILWRSRGELVAAPKLSKKGFSHF